MVSGARVDGEYVPSNADAFYHARRILDVVMTGQPVQQFDMSIHVPEGSWIPWPWGFDTAMAAVVTLFGPFTAESDAAAVLLHLPVAAAVIAVALLVLLWRQLQLSLPAAMLATFLGVVAPAFTFSGIFTPAGSLDAVGRFVSQLIPATYFMEIVRGSYLKGGDFAVYVPSLRALGLYCVIVYAAAWLALRKRLA